MARINQTTLWDNFDRIKKVEVAVKICISSFNKIGNLDFSYNELKFIHAGKPQQNDIIER